jgi:hypothetical protein
VNTAMNLRVPHIVGKFLSIYVTGDFLRRAQLRELSQITLLEQLDMCAVSLGNRYSRFKGICVENLELHLRHFEV